MLTANVTVTGAELAVTIGQNGVMTTGGVTVHQVLEPWIDNQAIWGERLTGVPWTAAGCGVGSRSATVLATFSAYMAREYKFSIPASVVQGWVSNASTNFGFALVGTPGSDLAYFRQSGGNTNADPVLSVTYRP